MAKIDLSTRESVKVTLSAGAHAMRVDVDRELLNELASDLLARTEECMKRAFNAAELGWPSLDAVLLVGGSSRMAAVKDLIRELSGKEPSTDVNPDECVALGAALRASLGVEETAGVPVASRSDPASPGSQEVGIVVNDVAPHSLGVRAVNSEGQPVNSIIIRRLTPVPCERKRTYATRADDQRSIEIEVLQGEDPDPFSIEVEGVGRVKVDNLPERPAGGVIVAVSLRYDADGVVEVVAEELVEGRIVREQLLRKSGELDSRTIAEMQSRVEALTQDDLPPPEVPAEPPDSAADAPASAEDAASMPADENDDDVDLYAALGVSRTATASEIEAAAAERRKALEERRRAAETLDPDAPERAAVDAELATLDEATAILLDAAARADYDSLGKEQPGNVTHAPDDSENSGEHSRD